LSIAELARQCGLSQLCRREFSLTEIGLACGFADQSHFTRVFTQLVGVSPAARRRGAIS
jgi:AraC-like DNA-binding protein